MEQYMLKGANFSKGRWNVVEKAGHISGESFNGPLIQAMRLCCLELR